MTALFTDTQSASDELLKRHREVAEDVLHRIGGVESRHNDGGISATIADPDRALLCAVQIQRTFENWGSSQEPPVRVGISHDDEDAVAVAARANGGEILLTDSVRELTAPRGHLCTDRGARAIYGIAVPLFAPPLWGHE